MNPPWLSVESEMDVVRCWRVQLSRPEIQAQRNSRRCGRGQESRKRRIVENSPWRTFRRGTFAFEGLRTGLSVISL